VQIAESLQGLFHRGKDQAHIPGDSKADDLLLQFVAGQGIVRHDENIRLTVGQPVLDDLPVHQAIVDPDPDSQLIHY